MIASSRFEIGSTVGYGLHEHGFFGAYPGAFIAPAMMVVLARGAFRAARHE